MDWMLSDACRDWRAQKKRKFIDFISQETQSQIPVGDSLTLLAVSQEPCSLHSYIHLHSTKKKKKFARDNEALPHKGSQNAHVKRLDV